MGPWARGASWAQWALGPIWAGAYGPISHIFPVCNFLGLIQKPVSEPSSFRINSAVFVVAEVSGRFSIKVGSGVVGISRSRCSSTCPPTTPKLQKGLGACATEWRRLCGFAALMY